MISSTIKKRTQEVNKQLNQVWCEKWMEYIEQHPEHPWDWDGISFNPTLTMEYVEQHPEHPWDWYEISQNDFKKAKNTFEEKKYREHLSAFKIQQWFRKIAENPNHKSGICKRRVNAAYDKLFNIVENE